MIVLAGTIAAILAVVHVFGGRLRFLDVIPRSRWLSAAGGISVAYVFVHVLPDLAHSQRVIRETMQSLAYLEHHVYLMALFGLVVFYGLERLAKHSRWRHAGHDQLSTVGVFWVHMSSFALYNGLVGYLLLHRERPGLLSLLFFGLAMATHFLVNDYGLRQDHKHRYDDRGRWLLAASVLVGFAVGVATEVHRAAIAMLFSFLAGGVVLNVLKEELPEERQSAFWAFGAGAAGYAAMLLLV